LGQQLLRKLRKKKKFFFCRQYSIYLKCAQKKVKIRHDMQMSHSNKYLWWRIVSFCTGSYNEIGQMRQVLFTVCKKWRNEFKLHLLLDPTSAYRFAIKAQNFRLANAIWDFSADCIDCRSMLVTEAVFRDGNQMQMCRLIARSDFDPSRCRNLAICLASAKGCDEVIKLLLRDARIDPNARNGCAIRRASQNGHTSAVQLLLKDHRVDPSADMNHAVRYACENGHVEVVRVLLGDARVDPSACDNCAICYASERGHSDVVELLLKDSRVDPADRGNWPIRYASQNGHIAVVRLLLQDHRVDPTTGGNYALRWAMFNDHSDVVHLLLKDTRVYLAARNNAC